MKQAFDPDRFDVAGFAEAGARVSGQDPLDRYRRLAGEANAESAGDSLVEWQAEGLQRVSAGGAIAPWLHVEAQTGLPMVCQRCLGVFEVRLVVDRWFRFAADEATAATEDEESEEDVLALEREIDLRALIEDELLMEIPSAPRHEECPQPLPLSVADEDFESEQQARPNPFAVLGGLVIPKGK